MASFSGITTVPATQPGLADPEPLLGDSNDLEHPETLNSINNMGYLLSMQGKYDEAMSFISEALETQRRTLGEDHPETLTSINNMGFLLGSQGKNEESLLYYSEALEARRRIFGNEHPDTLASINNMGYVLSIAKRYEEAWPYYNEALDSYRRILGGDVFCHLHADLDHAWAEDRDHRARGLSATGL